MEKEETLNQGQQGRGQNTTKEISTTEVTTTNTTTSCTFKKRNKISNGKSTLRKRTITEVEESGGDDNYSGDNKTNDLIDHEQLESAKKKRKTNGKTITTATQKGKEGMMDDNYHFTHESTHSILPEVSPDKIATVTIEEEVTSKVGNLGKVEGVNTYQGQSGYTQYIEPKLVPKASRIGPVKGSSNIRTTSRMDLQPDVCKDWKQMAYCGYGDTCKFLHDRGDFKNSVQIEKEWVESLKKQQEKLKNKRI